MIVNTPFYSVGETTAFIESIFRQEDLRRKRQEERTSKLAFLSQLNERKCSAESPYPSDLIDCFTVNSEPSDVCIHPHDEKSIFNIGQGHFHCQFKESNIKNPRNFMHHTGHLMNAITTTEERSSELDDVLKKFVFCVPAVASSSIKMHVPHPVPSDQLNQELFEKEIESHLGPTKKILHSVVSNMRAQFPETRLIQYDCGKLQTLDTLLWQLKSEGHRVLIFTQMSRMLDIFEQFLNHHGHTYLRLDGATKIEQRQALMERFNADKKVFCFILSTRSGGVGVNLTGADTVIFYDSDWNPTMDAQAQDRCHRIGQTRDVHIYRLVCIHILTRVVYQGLSKSLCVFNPWTNSDIILLIL